MARILLVAFVVIVFVGCSDDESKFILLMLLIRRLELVAGLLINAEQYGQLLVVVVLLESDDVIRDIMNNMIMKRCNFNCLHSDMVDFLLGLMSVDWINICFVVARVACFSFFVIVGLMIRYYYVFHNTQYSNSDGY